MTSPQDSENMLIMETTKGKVVIGLRPDLAPKHVERIKSWCVRASTTGLPFIA